MIALAMWVHVILNAMVIYEPTPPPHEWKGEVRLIPGIVATIGVWCVAVGFS